MSHLWIVKQGDKELGTVEAITRKGACHEAYDKFGIEQSKRNTITVERAATGGVVSGQPPYLFGDVVCSFNPALAGPAQEKTLEACRQRFETGPFTGFPEKQ